MATELAQAYVQIIPSAEGIAGNLTNLLGGEAESAGSSAGSLFSQGFEGGIGGIASIAATVVGGMVDAIGAVASTMADEISGIAAYGDSIDKLSQKMGISAQAYQEWDFIAQHSGTSMESLRSSFKTLSSAAQNGKESFEAIGLSLEDVQSMSTEDLFGAVIEGLQGMEEGTERTAIASELLGKGATELGALLNTSAEDTAAMKQQVHDLGGVLSDEAVKDAAAFQDSLQNLNVSFDGLKNGALSELLPSITQIMDGLTAIVTGDKSGLKAISSGIDDFVKNLSTGIAEMMPVILGIVTSIGDAIIENAPLLIESAGELIIQLANGIVENLPKILKTGLEIIVSIIKGITENLPNLIKTITSVVIDIAKELTNPDTLVSIIKAGIELIISLTQGIIEALPELIETMPEIIDNIVDALIECLPLIIDAGFKLFSALLDNLPQILLLVISATIDIVNSIINKLIESGPEIVNQGYEMFMKLIQKIPGFLVELKKSVGTIVDKLKEFFTDKFETIKNIGKDIVDNIWNGISAAWNGLKSKVEGLINGLIDGITGKFSDADYSDAIQSSMDNVSLEAAPTMNNMMNSYNGGDMAQDTINGSLFNMLAEYLPIIASGKNTTVVLEGDAEGLFNAVRERNTLYTQSTNYNPMVSG